ncbi:DegT/DnrJ/EryC1/StrS family aminotransferase [Thermodesulfobacteriota bacterium]
MTKKNRKSVARLIARLGKKSLVQFIRFLKGKPLTYPSFGSATLDADDVRIARDWLNNRDLWYDNRVVSQYEKEFARWNGSRHAFAFMSGRVSLSACIHALGLKPHDEIILPGYTCVVVPNALQYAGVKPVYSDIELDTYGLDATMIEDKISPKTRAILIQHLYGLVCKDYERIVEIARKRGLKIIEDCAHSTGAKFNGVNIGNWGDVAFYSTEQSKVITTIQGGIAVTNDDSLARRFKDFYDQAPLPDEDWIKKQLLKVLYNYYQYKHPQRWLTGDVADFLWGDDQLISTTAEEECGIKPSNYGCRMPSPIAAIGLNQIKKINNYNEIRRQSAFRWDKWCDDKGYRKPLIIPDSEPVYLRYPVLVEEEKKRNTTWGPEQLGVRIGVWFKGNIHPIQKPIEDCPNADRAVQQCINFPCLPK